MVRRLLLLALLGGCAARHSPEPAAPPPLSVGGATIDVDLRGREGVVPDAALRAWVERAATTVASYYGRFPVERVEVVLARGGWGAIGGGMTHEGKRIFVRAGGGTREADLDEDWVLIHEMFHLGFPDIDGDDHEWMGEGLSTYLEPIARAREGNLAADAMWADLFDGLPKGLPGRGDRGLAHTHTWGRTYWGGCLFWLIADVRIREETKGAKSLDDALRAILDAGGDGTKSWPAADVLAKGDAATGTRVLATLYEELALAPGKTDLGALRKKLGVQIVEGETRFDDTAPAAAIRKAITQSK